MKGIFMYIRRGHLLVVWEEEPNVHNDDYCPSNYINDMA